MKTKFLLTALLLVAALLVKGQQTVKSPAQPDSIIKLIPIQTANNTIYAYTIGGKLVTREDVAVRLKAYAPSAVFYDQFKNNQTWSYVSVGVSGVASIASVIAFYNSSGHTVATMGVAHNNSAGYIFAGVATAFVGSAIVNWAEGLRHFKKSVKAYNRRFESE